MSGMVLFIILRSVNEIASLWDSDVAGAESTLLVGFISLILSMGYAVGMKNEYTTSLSPSIL